MHSLHKILVYIPDAESRDYRHIRAYAEEATQPYQGQVFDWREVETAGRWEGKYPTNVIYASDDPELFINELNEVFAAQKGLLDTCLENITQNASSDIAEITRASWELTGYPWYPLCLYYLSCILNGTYISDSLFYNSHDSTSRIYRTDIETIKREPWNWALVMFDCHC